MSGCAHLGDLLALGRGPAGDIERWLAAQEKDLAELVCRQADLRGETPAQFLRIAVSDFVAAADEAAWTNLVSAIRDAADADARCVARMVRFRMRLESAT